MANQLPGINREILNLMPHSGGRHPRGQVGQTTFSPEAVDDLVADTGDLTIELTERERMVLTFLAQGMSNKEIGKLPNRSPFTVRHHVSQLIMKLSASNRAEVAAIAVERGLI